jgi:hypothetical protein
MSHRMKPLLLGTLGAVCLVSAVAVGSRVRLTEQTGDDKARRVTVKLEG